MYQTRAIYEGFPYEIEEEIISYLHGQYGMLRSVSKNFMNLIDSSSIITPLKRNETKLCHCFQSESLFNYTLKNIDPSLGLRFTEKDVKKAILLNLFPLEIALIVFNTVPIKFSTLHAMILKDRIDLLHLIEENWDQIFCISIIQIHHQQKMADAIFTKGSENAMNWLERMNSKFSTFKNLKSLFNDETLYDFDDMNLMKDRIIRYPKISDRISYYSSSFTIEDWIDFYPFYLLFKDSIHIEFNINLNFELGSNPQIDVDSKVLILVKQKIKNVLRFCELFYGGDDIRVSIMRQKVFKQIFLTCHDHNLIQCIKYLLYDYGILGFLQEAEDEFFFKTPSTRGSPSTTRGSPFTREYLDFWFSLVSQNQQHQKINKMFVHHHIFMRLVHHDQADLIEEYFEKWFNGFEFFVRLRNFLVWKPKRALKYTKVTNLFMRLTLEQTWNNFFLKDDQNLQKYVHVFQTLLSNKQYSPLNELTFACLYCHVCCLGDDDDGNDVRLRIVDGTYPSDVAEWIISLFPDPDKEDEILSLKFQSLDVLKEHFSHILSLTDNDNRPELWYSIFPAKKYRTIEVVKDLARFLKQQNIPFRMDYYNCHRYWGCKLLNRDIDFLLFLVKEIDFPLFHNDWIETIFKTLNRKNKLDLLPIFLDHYLKHKPFVPNCKEQSPPEINCILSLFQHFIQDEISSWSLLKRQEFALIQLNYLTQLKSRLEAKSQKNQKNSKSQKSQPKRQKMNY